MCHYDSTVVAHTDDLSPSAIVPDKFTLTGIQSVPYSMCGYVAADIQPMELHCAYAGVNQAKEQVSDRHYMRLISTMALGKASTCT